MKGRVNERVIVIAKSSSESSQSCGLSESSVPLVSSALSELSVSYESLAKSPVSSASLALPSLSSCLPRSGEPGSLRFDGINVSDFLRHWIIECEDYRLSDVQKCRCIVDYCAPELTIEYLQGYRLTN